MNATRLLLAACSLIVLSTAAHAAGLTRGEKRDARAAIRADARAQGVYPAGARPSLRVRFTDNGDGTHAARATTYTMQAGWPSFQLQRLGHADASFTVTPSLATVTPPPAPQVNRTTPWAVRMYALNAGN